MTNKNGTKRAFLMSLLSLVLCLSMLVGTTFAWFTDEVTSTGNIIKSGSLDAGLYYGDSANRIDTDASNGAIFNYEYWEPGYTQVKYVKITNEGDLAFKFQLNIIPNVIPAQGEYNLADVIDVYMFDATATVDRAAIAAATPVGTLAELMADGDGAAHGVLLPAEGVGSNDYNTQDNAPRGELTYCIVLKMQETAGNEYQNLSVGGGFKVQLLATQYTWENDAFDHEYDKDSAYDKAPYAEVIKTGAKMILTSTHDWILANTTFQFQPTESYEQALQSAYRLYHADFVVYADKDIPANAVILPGYYTAYCDDYNDHKWIGLESDEIITAGTQIRLVDTLDDLLGGEVTVNYEAICQWGNDGTGFLCGVSTPADANGRPFAAGVTITVELRLYEVPAKGECANGGGCNHPSTDCETGDYIVIGTYTYTVPEVLPEVNP